MGSYQSVPKTSAFQGVVPTTPCERLSVRPKHPASEPAQQRSARHLQNEDLKGGYPQHTLHIPPHHCHTLPDSLRLLSPAHASCSAPPAWIRQSTTRSGIRKAGLHAMSLLLQTTCWPMHAYSLSAHERE